MENIDGGLGFKATLDIDDFKVSAEAMEKHVKKVSNNITEDSAEMENSIMKFAQNGARYIVSYLVGQGLNSVLQSVIQTRGQFQQLEIAFKTMLGSGTKAQVLMNQLVDTAARTPYDLLGVTGSAKQLLAYGVAAEDVNDTLVRLGNIASGLSIPLQDIAYLYGTTMTQGRLYAQDLNQFTGRGIPMVKELAKILGVAENQVKQLVSEGKVGFPEVEQVIKNLTNEGGMFFNLMQEQSKSLSGMVSNLGDAWDSALNRIGERNQDLLASGLSGATYLVENLDEILRIVKAIAIAYGSYKAAVVLNTLAIKGHTGVALIDKTVESARAMVLHKSIIKTKGLTFATKLLWRTMKNNPVGWLVSLLGMALSAFTLFNRKEKESNETTLGLANATKRANEEFATQASEVDALQKVMRDSNQTYDARNKALQKLKEIIPEYNAEITKEGTIINDNNKAIEKYLANLEKQIKLKAAQEELEEAYKQKRLAEKDKEAASKYIKDNKPVLDKQIAEHNRNNQNAVSFNSTDAATQALTSFYTTIDQELLDSVNEAEKKFSKADNDLKAITTTIDELNKEISETSLSMESSSKKAKNWTEQVEDTKVRIKSLTKEIEDLRSGKVVKDNLASEIDAKIKELNGAKNDLALLTGRDTKKEPKKEPKNKAEKKSIDDQLKYKKEQYELYFRWVEGMGETVANKKFADLIKSGKSYSEFINNQIAALEQKKAQGDLSQEDQDMLFSFGEQRDQIAGKKSAMDLFRDSIAQTVSQASSLAAKLVAIADAKEKLAKGGFNLNPDQTLDAQNELDLMDKEAQKELNQSILDDYKSYEEKKNEITANFNAMRLADIVRNNEELLAKINKGEAAALSALDAEQLTASESWKNLFSNLDSLSASEIQKLIDEIESKMASADLKLSPVDFQALRDSLDKAKDKVVSLNPFRALGNAFDNYIKACKKLKQAEKDNLSADEVNKLKREVKKSAQEITDCIGSINEVVGSVGNSLSSIASSFGNEELSGTIGSVTDALAGAGQTAMGVGQIMSGDILGGVTSVVSGISSVIGAFNAMHDAKKEKQIKKLQVQIDSLADSYDNLGDSIARAYSTDKANMLEAQNRNLESQNELIRQQIQQEKEKKKTDWDRIKEWEEQIKQNEKEIADNRKYHIIEAIMGTDIASAIDEFANAYADAWAKGEKAAGHSAEVVKRLIKTAIIEQLKNKLKPEVEKFMSYMADALEDGVISESEERMLDYYQSQMEQQSDKYLSQNGKWLKDDEENDKEDAMKGAVRSLSEETGGIIAGRMNAVVIEVSEQTAVMKSSIKYQAEIAQNTKVSADRLGKIESTLKRIENKDSSLLSQGIS